VDGDVGTVGCDNRLDGAIVNYWGGAIKWTVVL